MENSQRIILSGIKEMISSMYREIHELENKLGEIEIKIDKALGVENVAVDLDYVPVAGIEEDTRIETEQETVSYEEESAGESMSSEVVSDNEYEMEEQDGKEPEMILPSLDGILETPGDIRDMQDGSSDVKTLLAEELEKDSRPAVMDVMTAKEPWRTDRPGASLKDIRSAISLNDRALFINYLFREDPSLFIDTVSVFNSMETLDEAVGYLKDNFPEWDMQSEVVYRFMMAVRRKLR